MSTTDAERIARLERQGEMLLARADSQAVKLVPHVEDRLDPLEARDRRTASICDPALDLEHPLPKLRDEHRRS